MAVTLLPLSNGHCLLEFEPSDLPPMEEAIHDRYGVPDKRQYSTSAEIASADAASPSRTSGMVHA